MYLFTMPRAGNKGCWSMAGSSSNGGSMSKVIVGRVWERNVGGNGCGWHDVLGIGVV